MISRSPIYCDTICRLEGILKTRKTQDVNATLLTTLDWKVLNDYENILIKVVSTKYLTKDIS